MEVRRSLNGKVALVISTGAYVKFLTIGPNGPKFDMLDYKAFYSNFNKVVPMTEVAAALSFLKAANHYPRFNGPVLNFLLGEILMKNLSDMSLEELVSRYNAIAVAAGKKSRKSFDSKKAALEAIEKLNGEVQAPSPEQIKAAEGLHAKRSTTVENAENKEVKVRGKGIGKRAMELLLEGKSTQEVINIVKEEIPDANPTPATIAWYKNKLRQDGKLAKPEKKEKPVKAEAAPAPDATTDTAAAQ